MNNYFYNELQEKLLKYQSSIFINYNEFFHLLQTDSKFITAPTEFSGEGENFRKVSQVIYPDLSEVAENLRKSMQLPYPNFSGITQNFRKGSQVNYPDLNGIAENLRKSMQLPYPNFSGITQNFRKGSQVIYPDLSEVAENFRRTMQLTSPNFSDFVQNFRKGSQIIYPDLSGNVQSMSTVVNLSVSNLDWLVSINDILSNFSSRFSDIDWNDDQTTEVDLEEAEDILKSPDMEEQLNKELKSEKTIKKSIILIVKYIYYVVSFFSGLILIADFTEEKIIPATQNFHYYLETEFFNSEREATKWLNDELKKDAEMKITRNFRIVTKNNLIVRENKKVSSNSQGSLSHGDVVQIIEKKRNWTYIHFSDHEEKTVIEGWVFTRYLKQIK